jgi:hypothetical protein
MTEIIWSMEKHLMISRKNSLTLSLKIFDSALKNFTKIFSSPKFIV